MNGRKSRSLDLGAATGLALPFLRRGVGAAPVVVFLVGAQVFAQTPTGSSTGSSPIAIEVKEEQLADRTRLTYTIRNLGPARKARGTAIVRLIVGADASYAEGRLTALPTDLDSPAGWEPKIIPVDAPEPTTWQVSWSCDERGWEHRLKNRIGAGGRLGGFRLSLPLGNVSYRSAGYSAVTDIEGGVSVYGPFRLDGNPFVKGGHAH